MENYKHLLQEQEKALKQDILYLVEQIKQKEVELELLKDRKSQAFKYLKAIEKKLANQLV